MTITPSMIEAAYQAAQRAYEIDSKAVRRDQIEKLISDYQMNRSTARMYIKTFKHMRQGISFNRTLSSPSFKYYLDHIYQDYGASALSTALSSMYLHITYYEEIRKIRLRSVREIYDSYSSLVPMVREDQQEQQELEDYFRKNKSREHAVKDLQNLKVSDPEIVTVNGKHYKRDNKTIAQLKLIRNFQCQLCDAVILKKNGEKYVEAAHIQAKRHKGPESPDNILIVCPNHHKEFDYGNLQILAKDAQHISFLLNGRLYEASLSFS